MNLYGLNDVEVFKIAFTNIFKLFDGVVNPVNNPASFEFSYEDSTCDYVFHAPNHAIIFLRKIFKDGEVWGSINGMMLDIIEMVFDLLINIESNDKFVNTEEKENISEEEQLHINDVLRNKCNEIFYENKAFIYMITGYDIEKCYPTPCPKLVEEFTHITPESYAIRVIEQTMWPSMLVSLDPNAAETYANFRALAKYLITEKPEDSNTSVIIDIDGHRFVLYDGNIKMISNIKTTNEFLNDYFHYKGNTGTMCVDYTGNDIIITFNYDKGDA